MARLCKHGNVFGDCSRCDRERLGFAYGRESCHHQTFGLCSLCSTQLDGLIGVQTGPRLVATTLYEHPISTQLDEPDKTAMESELATMSGCILALSEHTSAERHRILHTISAFFED